MRRSFHHRFTIGAACGIVLLLALAIYAFWVKSIGLGVMMALLLTIVAERTLHTEYAIDDDKLTINKGRLAKELTIDLAAITACHPMTTVFGMVRCLVITYGSDNRLVAVQPCNERAFVELLRKRIAEAKGK